ncbi:MAG: rhodanese-like domain-containing protein [Gammaproteobacteria bacterium]|nr:rhodanese-like domain-containing protein [Gammaproteobacteria bacterium]
MKKFQDLIAQALQRVKEVFPWDLEELIVANPQLLLLDVREPYEFAELHISGSINVPRGILESACEWNYEETEPLLVNGRDREIVVICRSGYRSVLAADVMLEIGFTHVCSLKTGVRGWNDYELPLVNEAQQQLPTEEADRLLTSRVQPHQRRPV